MWSMTWLALSVRPYPRHARDPGRGLHVDVSGARLSHPLAPILLKFVRENHQAVPARGPLDEGPERQPPEGQVHAGRQVGLDSWRRLVASRGVTSHKNGGQGESLVPPTRRSVSLSLSLKNQARETPRV
jgi:hypothetical protein